jgi:hypothetical protein
MKRFMAPQTIGVSVFNGAGTFTGTVKWRRVIGSFGDDPMAVFKLREVRQGFRRSPLRVS